MSTPYRPRPSARLPSNVLVHGHLLPQAESQAYKVSLAFSFLPFVQVSIFNSFIEIQLVHKELHIFNVSLALVSQFIYASDTCY